MLIQHDPQEQAYHSSSLAQETVAEETIEERPIHHFGKRLRRERCRRWLQANHNTMTISLGIIFLISVLAISLVKSLNVGQDFIDTTAAKRSRLWQLTQDRSPGVK